MRDRFRPVDLARDVAISAASVRLYEREGFLPPVERSASGHRLYRTRHLHALRVSRTLMKGYGWQYARRVMREVHRGDIPAVMALVDAKHAGIDRGRSEVEAAIRALRLLSERLAKPPGPGELAGHLSFVRVGEAARLAGVRPSAVRFWEQEGLLHPRRDARSGYRLYDRDDVERLRIIIVLRDAGYRFDDMRLVLAELGGGNPAAALVRAQRRADELERVSLACMEATAALWGYLARYAIDEQPPLPRTDAHA
jgi:DNA-binding transcriptional MerR regulator